MVSTNELQQSQILPDIFLTGVPARDKIIKTFFSAFQEVIPDSDPTACGKLAYEIESYIRNEKVHPQIVKTKFLNLKMPQNQLCYRIYYNELSIGDFFNLTPEQMKSTEMTQKDAKMVQEGISNSQMAESGEVTNIFTCGKCKQKNCRYRQLQTRSADEPMTTFVFCKCGHVWKC
ncbi:transcription elongation factor S-II [Pseudoloma neurophilia]|uniref:Transcription elongation factor S-II n=1 Tax=Pseudoloma neurophilia TaxID=146866 RepID=A0A0R0M886_9MICR|nr:transcription elongation factor S-II [Pseudoloma neurophilia]